MSEEVYSIHIKVDSTQANTATRDLGKLETAANKTESSLKQLSSSSAATGNAAKTLSGAMASTEDSMRKATGAMDNVSKAANAIRGAFVVLIGVEVARFMREIASTVREAADAYTQLSSRLAVGTVSQIEAGKAMREVTQIANKYYLSIVDVGNAYSKLNPILADMGRNQADTRAVVESVSAALAAQNGEVVDSAETMRQLSQALSGNVLQMEEMNTIIDSAQPLWRGLNKVFAESVAKFGSLKNAISSQAVTSEMLTDALIRLKPEFEDMAARITPTLSKAMTVLNNNFITYIGEADKAKGASKDLGKMILDLADNLDTVLDPWMEFGKATGEAGVAFVKLGSELAPALEVIAKGLAGFFTTVSTSLEGLKLLADGLGAITGNVDKLKSLLGVTEASVSDKTLERINKEIQLNKEKLSQYGEMDRYKLLDGQKIKDLEKEIAILTRMKELVFQNADAKRKAEEEEIKRIDAQRQANKRPDVVDEKAAKKAREEAERNFTALMDFQVAQAENMAKIAKAQNETRLKQIESEKKALKDAAEVDLLGAKTKEERLAIYKKLQESVEAQIVKETEIRQQMLQGEVDLEQKRIDSADQLLAKSAEYQYTQADILRIQKEIAEAQTGIETAPESAKQLEIEMMEKLRASAEGYNKELANNKDVQKDVREEALRTLEVLSSNLEYSREMANGLSEAFGEIGDSIGGLTIALAEYEKQSATIEIARKEAIDKAKGDQKKIEEINQDSAGKQARAQIKLYGDMTQAAQGFFKKGTKGYEAMGAAVKVFRVFEMAQSAMAMGKQIQDMGTVLAQFLGMETAKTTAKQTSNAQQAASDATGAVVSGQKAVADASQGDPYTGIIRGAAMLAFLAAIGIAIGGGGGGGGAAAAPQPDMTGRGTVKGDPMALSESISKSLAILEENSSNDLNYSAEMLQALLDIKTALGAAADDIATIIQPLIGGLVSQFGSDAVKQAGVILGSQDLSRIRATGTVQGQAAARIETESSMLGITIKKGQTLITDLSPKLEKAFGDVVLNIEKGIRDIGKSLGIGNEEISKNLAKFKVNIGQIDIAGLNAEEAAKKIEAAFSAMSDKMARKALPGFEDFNRVGEGYFETVVRVAEGTNRAKGELERLGMQAISYTEVADRQGDIAEQIARQTIIAQSDLGEGAKKYVSELTGSLDDIIEGYKKLAEISRLMDSVGASGDTLDRTIVNAAGGLDELQAALEEYYDRFLTDEQKVISETERLSKEFGKLGYALPKSQEEFTKLLLSFDRTTESGKKLFGQMIGLSGQFADLTDKMKEQKEAAEEAAQQADQERKRLEQERLSTLQKAIDDAFSSMQKAYQDLTSIQDRFVKLSKSLRAYMDELVGPASQTISPEQRYFLARQEFERIRGLAGAGNEEAVSALAGVSKTFLDASRNYNASSEAYQTDLQMVVEAVAASTQYADDQVNLAQQSLDIARGQYDRLGQVNVSVLSVAQGIAGMNVALGNYAAAVAAKQAELTSQLAAANAAAAAASAASTSAATPMPRPTPSTPIVTAFGPSSPARNWGYSPSTALRGPTYGSIDMARDNIEFFYKQLLNRSAEEPAKTNYARLLAQGTKTEAQIVAEIRSSPEYNGLLARGFVPGFARGGMAQAGLAIVGEQGPELINMQGSGYVTPAGATANFFGSIKDAITLTSSQQMSLMKEQVTELQALVRLQAAANRELINQLSEIRSETAESTRLAKVEATA